MTDTTKTDTNPALQPDPNADPNLRSKSLAGAGEMLADEDAVVVTVQRVEIRRDNDTIVTDVPEHEVAILEVIHLPENVQVIDEDVTDIDLDGSAEAEWARLKAKYDQSGDESPLLRAYPEGQRALVNLGWEKSSKGRVVQQASVKTRAPQRASANKSASKATKQVKRGR